MSVYAFNYLPSGEYSNHFNVSTFSIKFFLVKLWIFPSHYLSTPGLIWNAMVKMTKIEVEFIPDPDMYIFFEKGIRGGFSYICIRYSKDNNKCLKSYDPKQESKHIINLDDNNSYLEISSNKWTEMDRS